MRGVAAGRLRNPKDSAAAKKPSAPIFSIQSCQLACVSSGENEFCCNRTAC
jgi:hypothetical protein